MKERTAHELRICIDSGERWLTINSEEQVTEIDPAVRSVVARH